MTDTVDVIDELNAELMRHQRGIHLMRGLMAAWLPGNLDWGASQVLVNLVKSGPMRQGELAEYLLLDASTVSRRVGQLVALGYVERRPDPRDGRAVQLAATEQGKVLFARLKARREETMAHLFSTWPPEDVTEFLRLLRRLNDDLDRYRPALQATTAADPVPPFPAREAASSPTA